MSEFGRTTRQNSYINSVGTDHASGSNTLVIGGSVRGGVAGSDPTVADLIHPWNNSISPNIAFETPVGAALQWMGLNAVSIIPSYNSTTGNALQLFV